MTYDSWPTSTPPSDLAMMLGELRADTRHSVQMMARMDGHMGRMDGRLDQIDQRLARGDVTMTELGRRLDVIETRPEPPPPAWERNGKWLLTYLLPLAVFWATGNADTAKQALGLMLGK